MSQRISSPFGTVIIDEDGPESLFNMLGSEKKVHRHEPVSMTPPVDVYENDTHFSIWMDLPGVDKSSIQVSITGPTLAVNAETKKLNQQGGHWIKHERRTGNYISSLQLGNSVDPDSITANYADGTLLLTIDKKTKTETKNVDVKME